MSQLADCLPGNWAQSTQLGTSFSSAWWAGLGSNQAQLWAFQGSQKHWWHASECAILQELYGRTYLIHAPLMLPGPGHISPGDILYPCQLFISIHITNSS